MYTRLLKQSDESAFIVDQGKQLVRSGLTVGQKIVVRLRIRNPGQEMKSAGVIAREYGAVIDHINNDTVYVSVRHESTGQVRQIPLRMDSDGTLYSHPLYGRQGVERLNESRTPATLVKFAAYPAQPRRAFGYVLAESFAREEIVKIAKKQKRSARRIGADQPVLAAAA